jgi:hypothetical protein
MAPVREVAFELECFEWADERLEVAGRWKGLGPHRLNRPVLTLDTDGGRRKRVVALPGGHFGGAGETWRASFAWPGDPGEITAAELEVGGNLVVDLPLPDKRRTRRRRSAGDQHADEALRAEAAALRGQIERLRAELAGREREIIALRAQLDEVAEAEDDEPARAGADERTVEIQRLAGELERLREEKQAGAEAMTVELQRLSAERDAAAADRARWQEDIDELRQAFADAAAEAEEARDRHGAEIAALEERLEEERAEVARLSGELSARDERDREAAPARDEAAARRRAAAPPTQPMPEPTAPMPAPDDASAAGPPTQAMPPPDDATAATTDAGNATSTAPDSSAVTADASTAAGPPTQAMPRPDGATPASGDDATIEAAVLDAPGPLRAASRPTTPPGEDVPQTPLADAEGSSAFQALKARFEGLFATNGDRHDNDDEEQAVPKPLRTASAARARAGTAVAARRSPGEVWATRVLAAIVVAVLLTAFVLILAYIA